MAVSGDSQSVVAADAVGTLGWHRLSHGERYLTAFIYAEDRRRVARMLSDYCWASCAEAERLLGWHINAGAEGTPMFCSAFRRRQRFQLPDVIQTVF